MICSASWACYSFRVESVSFILDYLLVKEKKSFLIELRTGTRVRTEHLRHEIQESKNVNTNPASAGLERECPVKLQPGPLACPSPD